MESISLEVKARSLDQASTRRKGLSILENFWPSARCKNCDRSERDVVVHVAVASATAGSSSHAARGRARAAEVAAALLGIAASAAATATFEHGEVRVEALQHDLGGIL